MTETERELWEALQELLCCPAFNGQVFMRDSESHRAWTLARDVAERHRPAPDEAQRRGIKLKEAVDMELPPFLRRQAE